MTKSPITIEKLAEMTARGFAEMQDQFRLSMDQIEKRFNGVEKRLDHVEGEIDDIKAIVRRIYARQLTADTLFENHELRICQLEKQEPPL